MLEKLILKRFQSHRQIEVDLNHPVTTIIGPNDSGKTALIRAIKWIAFNRPQGEEFIQGHEGTARAELIVDGRSIVRKRGKANVYILDGAPMKSFKSDVPKPISDLLNITEENIQEQLDSPFWFSISSGQVSKELNQIVDLEIIDETLRRLANKSRETKSEFELSGKRLEDLKSQIKELEWVEQAESDLTEIENAEYRLEGSESGILVISDSILSIRKATSELEYLRTASAKAGKLRKKVEALEAAEEEVNCLRSFAQEFAEFGEIQSKIELLIEINDKQQKLTKIESEIESLCQCLSLKTELNQIDRTIESSMKVFADNMKGKCPLCQK